MANGQVGRPPGPTAASLADGRRWLNYHRLGVPVSKIAPNEGVSESWVRDGMALVKEHPRVVDGEAAAESGATDAEPVIVKPPKPYTARTLLWRAWLVANMHPPASKLPGGIKLFWLSSVLAIGNAEGGLCLRYGESGYFDRADFCALHDMTEADLDLLVKRRLLSEMDGGSIALPKGLGLTPGEKTFRPALPPIFEATLKSAPSRSKGAREPVAGQAGFILGIAGGRQREGNTAGGTSPENESDGGISPGEIGNLTVEKNGEIGNLTVEKNGETPNLTVQIPGDGLARGTEERTAAAAKKEDSSILSSSSSSSSCTSRAGDDTGKMGNLTGEIPGEITAPDQAVVVLGEELARLAKLPNPLNVLELSVLAGWLAAGLTRDTIIRVVTKVMTRKNRPKIVSTLIFFDGAIADEIDLMRKVGPRPPTPVAAEPAASVSQEDAAIVALIKAPKEAFARDTSAYPFPPSLQSFKAADAAGERDLAQRWLDLYQVWVKSNRQVGRPPDFRGLSANKKQFVIDLETAEDELTAPRVDAAAD